MCWSAFDTDRLVCSMISHRVPLEDFPKLYKAFDKRQAGVLKVFVETKFSNPPAPGCPQTSRVDDWANL